MGMWTGRNSYASWIDHRGSKPNQLKKNESCSEVLGGTKAPGFKFMEVLCCSNLLEERPFPLKCSTQVIIVASSAPTTISAKEFLFTRVCQCVYREVVGSLVVYNIGSGYLEEEQW
jgi:hypothetical protein